MKSSNLFLFLCGLSITHASTKQARTDPDDVNCLNRAEVNDIVARWTSLAIRIDPAVVDSTVTNDFEFFSDNQNFLEGNPYGSVTGTPSINGKQDLINQQTIAQAPDTPVIPQIFTILQTFHSCNTITFRWRFHAISSRTQPGSANQPGDPVEYAGIDILVVNRKKHLIKTAYSEWNSGELLYDLGVRTCFQKGNPNACPP